MRLISDFQLTRTVADHHPYCPAFEELYLRYQWRVRGICARFAGNSADAEDLAQEAFLLMYRKAETFRGESTFITWLYRLVQNVALMHFRKKGIQEVPLLHEDYDRKDEQERTPPVYFGRADAYLSFSLDLIVLQGAIGELPSGQQSIFWLHDVEGYGHREIGEMLGITDGASKSQLHKARMRLRAALQS